MEMRLFHRQKDIRLVRPERVAFFEWLRALRHNIFCEWIRLVDKAKALIQRIGMNESGEPTAHFDQRMGHAVRRVFNGQAAAESVKDILNSIKTKGVRESFWPFLFMLGIVLGVAAKWRAEDSITIGFEDYKLEAPATLYRFDELEEQLRLKQANPSQPTTKSYPACFLP